MNILIPHSWLLEHLETNATPQEIQRLLSLSGPSVERIHEIEGEPVYDIEVTTNRVDMMSVRGIAREAAVILSQAGIPSAVKPVGSSRFNASHHAQDDMLPLPKIVNERTLCKRIMCQVVADVQKVPSPEWMQKRLRQIGINVHDTIIDITNYVTHDLGHPCHAFDYDKVMQKGGVILVKEAEEGKKFTIIDGTEYETVGGEVVFENEEGEIIDLPAIKGTQNTFIADDTKNVLFWLENLDPKKVRFASMTHAIRTVAATILEKNVDPNLAEPVLEKGLELFTTLAHGTIASTRFDEFLGKKQLPGVTLRLTDVKRYLGVDLPTPSVVAILKNLGCQVSLGADSLTVVPPTFRPDIAIPADIIEEIARIYGYHNLPSTLMTGAIPVNKTADRYDLEQKAKEFFAALGAFEVYTYSMISEQQASLESTWVLTAFKEPQVDTAKTHVKLKNPLTDDMVYMRRTLWVSHLDVFKKNPHHKNLTVFEYANTYIPSSDASKLPVEEFHLTVTSIDDVRTVKGMIEALCAKFSLPTLSYLSTDSPFEATIQSGETKIGHVVSLPASLSQTDNEVTTVIDLDWKTILTLVRAYPQVQPIPKYTPIIEDFTFTIPTGSEIGRVLETIQEVSNVSLVSLKDVFKRNATFSVSYTSTEKQLTAEDASAIRANIVSSVAQKHNATLVGNQ